MKFWQIYDNYEEKLQVIGEKRLLLLHDYIKAYPDISDRRATDITRRCFRLDMNLARIQKQYYKKIKRMVSPVKAAQFMQVEGYLQHVVRVQIQNQIPFIGELAVTVKQIEKY